jgi:hypothetical protein
MKSKEGMKGIPKAHHKAVKAFLAMQRASLALKGVNGETASPQEAYEMLQADWLERRMQDKRQAAATQRIERQRTLASLPEILGKLGDVREWLYYMETDNMPSCYSPESAARFIRALLDEAGRELEHALFDLKALKAESKHDAQFLDFAPEGTYPEIAAK